MQLRLLLISAVVFAGCAAERGEHAPGAPVEDTAQAVVEAPPQEEAPDFARRQRAEEEPSLRTAAPFVRREGDRLILALASGGAHTLEDRFEPDDQTIVYTFRRHYARQGLYLAYYVLYEGYGYTLVSDSTGRAVHVPEEPIFSPDSARILVASEDLVAGYRPNVLKVFRVTPRGLEPEFSEEFEGWGPGEASWVDTATVSFKRVELDESANRRVVKGMLLRRGDGVWRMEEGT